MNNGHCWSNTHQSLLHINNDWNFKLPKQNRLTDCVYIPFLDDNNLATSVLHLYLSNIPHGGGCYLYDFTIRNSCPFFNESAPLGRFSHRVAMSICGFVVLRHWVQFFFEVSNCTMRKNTNLFFNFQGKTLMEKCIF